MDQLAKLPDSIKRRILGLLDAPAPSGASAAKTPQKEKHCATTASSQLQTKRVQHPRLDRHAQADGASGALPPVPAQLQTCGYAVIDGFLTDTEVKVQHLHWAMLSACSSWLDPADRCSSTAYMCDWQHGIIDTVLQDVLECAEAALQEESRSAGMGGSGLLWKDAQV
jgi:hypothetical protein